MGLHTAEAVVVERRYVNQPLNRCARIMAAAHGGQSIMSASTADVVRDELPAGVGLAALGTHRLRDLAAPVALFQVRHPELDRAFPPLRSLDSFAGNLPSHLSSFVGRTAEVGELAAAVRSSRLVTSPVPEVWARPGWRCRSAADLLPDFGDGAWLVELAPLATDADVVDAVATSLGRAGSGRRRWTR